LNTAFAPLLVTYVAAGVNRIKGQPQWWCVLCQWCQSVVSSSLETPVTMQLQFMTGAEAMSGAYMCAPGLSTLTRRKTEEGRSGLPEIPLTSHDISQAIAL
jgi:hypothetical protein